jgi:hypothetical protein
LFGATDSDIGTRVVLSISSSPLPYRSNMPLPRDNETFNEPFLVATSGNILSRVSSLWPWMLGEVHTKRWMTCRARFNSLLFVRGSGGIDLLVSSSEASL